MKESTIQTLHPAKGKKNRVVPVRNYKVVKMGMIKVVKRFQPTYTEMVSLLRTELKGRFHENVDWYTMTVKLDLEARSVIERTNTRPVRYRLK